MFNDLLFTKVALISNSVVPLDIITLNFLKAWQILSFGITRFTSLVDITIFSNIGLTDKHQMLPYSIVAHFNHRIANFANIFVVSIHLTITIFCNLMMFLGGYTPPQ